MGHIEGGADEVFCDLFVILNHVFVQCDAEREQKHKFHHCIVVVNGDNLYAVLAPY